MPDENPIVRYLESLTPEKDALYRELAAADAADEEANEAAAAEEPAPRVASR